MWLTLTRGRQATLTLSNRQSVWPANDDDDAELVVTTQAVLSEQITVASPQVVRFAYRIEDASGSLTLGDAPPAPWTDAARVKGQTFEIMLTPKGAVLAPAPAKKLPNRILAWQATIAEDLRAAWLALPDALVTNQKWRPQTGAVPGGLPPNALKATLDIECTALRVDYAGADIEARYDMQIELDAAAARAKHATGRGVMRVRTTRNDGFVHALRTSEVVLVKPHARNQSVRTVSELTRVTQTPAELPNEQTPPHPLPRALSQTPPHPPPHPIEDEKTPTE